MTLRETPEGGALTTERSMRQQPGRFDPPPWQVSDGCFVGMAVDMSKHHHNKVDPQPPTKTDLPAPVFFPYRRVSHSNHVHIPLIPIPFYPHFYSQLLPLSSLYQMARPRKSEQRDRKVQPPRPPNAWILYRSDQSKVICKKMEGLSQAAASKLIAEMWRNESEDVRRHYEQEAETKKAQHQEKYPDYRYCPQKREPKHKNKKSKAPRSLPSNKDLDGNDGGNPLPSVPAPLVIPSIPQSLSQTHSNSPVPAYHQTTIMPQPLMIPYFSETRRGPGGPSPPLSAAPSPPPHGGSESPLPPPSVASSSSSSPTQPSPSSESQASPSSLQLPEHSMYLPSPPNSHRPSPDPHATLPLSALLFQNSMSGELPTASPRPQLRSSENTVAPAALAWDNFSTYLPSHALQNSEEAVNHNHPIGQTQNFTEFQYSVPSGSSFESLQALLSSTDESGVFNLSNIESSALLNHPQGDLEIAMGPQALTVEYYDDLFADFDIVEFQRQLEFLKEGGWNSPTVPSYSVPEDIRSLFQTSNHPEPQTYMAAQQRQPSAFTQDMMNFLNFEAVEDATEDATSAVPPAPAPITVAPQQVRLQSTQGASAMPIFTQMTNTSAMTSGTPYVPPAGAIYSSTRRVAASWKPSFAAPYSQMDEPVPSWNL